MTLHVFDFDGTLTTRDTLLAFIRYARGTKAFVFGFVRYSPLLVLMKLHLYPNYKAKQKVFAHFFKGLREADFNRLCARFAAHSLHLLRPAGLEAMLRALAEPGARVAVVSASIDNWVIPFFYGTVADYGGEPVRVLGTRIEVRNGRLTGRFLTPNCYGEEKLRRLEEAFPDCRSCRLVAYGDSRGDRELLARADEPHFRPFREAPKSAAETAELHARLLALTLPPCNS